MSIVKEEFTIQRPWIYINVKPRTKFLLAKLVIGSSKAWIRSKEISYSDHTHSQYALASHNHDSTYAKLSHNHSASQITSGTLPASRGGTGVTSIDALRELISAPKIAFGSYYGDGTYGYSNATTITTPFAANLIIIYAITDKDNNYTYPQTAFLPLFKNCYLSDSVRYKWMSTVGSEISKSFEGGVEWVDDYTVKFWSEANNPAGQANALAVRYYWMAIAANY